MSKERKKLAATATSESPRSRLDVVKEWLSENYEVRVNLLDRSKVSIRVKPGCSMKYEHPVTEEDILLHAYADELPIPRTVLKMLLASPNQMVSFNPIHDYLNGLRGKYKGPSQIDLLCWSLNLSDQHAGARERARHILRKWLVATAACALGYRQNDVALGLVGEMAGIGKTTLLENLVPACLKEYYQVAQRDDRAFPMQNSFAHRLLINFDEFAAITKSNEQTFKQLMSATDVEIHRTGSRYVETVPRVASCCFTSNCNHRNGGFISRPDGGLLRRLAVIEVDTIADYRGKFDVDQLWAEVMMHLDSGFDPTWTQEEYRQFVDEIRQYVKETNALRLLRLYYRMPDSEQEGVFMTPMDIVLQLKEHRKMSSEQQRVSETTVGQALSVMGFQRHSKRIPGVDTPRYGYYIVPMFDSQLTSKQVDK